MTLWTPQSVIREEPHRVLLKRGEWVDDSRDGRVVPYKIYHPSGDNLTQMPVILWSHGFGGNRDGASFISRFLAGQGYTIVHMTHIGTDSSLWEGKPGHPWEILKNTQVSRSVTLDRFRDISFVLSAFPDWVQENSDDTFKAQLDLTKIGMSGHSFGALTTQVIAGQLTPDLDGQLISIHSDKIISSIAYSPVPGVSHLSNDMDENDSVCIYETIKTPLLHMTGTDDSSPINDMPYGDRLKIYDSTQLASKALLVKQGGDHMVYNGTRGALASNPLRDRHEELINVISLAWWDAWLKNDAAAMDWLRSDECSDYLGEENSWKIEIQ